MTCDAVIVGSGLAGGAAALGLARTGRDVVLFERRRLPAHKLCGEFLSPEVQRATDDLGVLSEIRNAGALPIRRTVLTAAGGAAFERPLPHPALGLSRYALDELLLTAVERAGVTVHREVTVTSVRGTLDAGFEVEAGGTLVRSRAVVGAWGRRDRLDRVLRRGDLGDRAPWVAFKAHYGGPHPAETVELHLFPGGYCGLSRVEGDRVNVCWIVHRDVLREAGGDPDRLVELHMSRNSALRGRFAELDRMTDPYLSASQLWFRPRSTFARDVCLVGDAAGMIAPLCGDGMAMAFDSAATAVRELDRFLADGEAARFRREYDTAWKRRFTGRMRIGRWLHSLFVHPAAAQTGLGLAAVFPRIGDRLIRATRGT